MLSLCRGQSTVINALFALSRRYPFKNNPSSISTPAQGLDIDLFIHSFIQQSLRIRLPFITEVHPDSFIQEVQVCRSKVNDPGSLPIVEDQRVCWHVSGYVWLGEVLASSCELTSWQIVAKCGPTPLRNRLVKAQDIKSAVPTCTYD